MLGSDILFTGIVEEVGRVMAIENRADKYSIKIACKKVLKGTKLGDSIASNGVCLTVTRLGLDYFMADIMKESLSRSNLGSLKENSRINLERALALGDRLGGHLLSGHIDTTGEVVGLRKDKNALWYTVKPREDILDYVVEKGSIGLDGISLTVVDVTRSSFTVSVIPHTLEETVLRDRKLGSSLNIEVDMLAKYLSKLLGKNKDGATGKGEVTMDLLSKNGFI